MEISKQSLSLDKQNPWPGLATYDETARDFFFGREEGQKIPGATAKYIAGFEDSTFIPKGQFEIWFAPDAFQ